jgi:polyisoprenoid-binding protein YceI
LGGQICPPTQIDSCAASHVLGNSSSKEYLIMQRRTIAILATVGVIVLAAGIWIIFFPNRGANANHKAPGAAVVTGTPIPTTGLTKYTIVPAQTTASYSVHEDLIIGGVGSNTAVGKTNSVQGSLFLGLNGAPQLTKVDVTVDLTSLQTDSAMRDNHVQQSLETDQFPSAEFTSTNVTGLPAIYTSGQTITFQMIGNLKLHGVTNKETFNVTGKVTGNSLTGSATTSIFMTDFGVQPPDLANIAIVDNKVTLTIDFTAQS